MKLKLLIFLAISSCVGCFKPANLTSAASLKPVPEGNPYAPTTPLPTDEATPTVNNVPIYFGPGNIGSSTYATPANSSESTQWLIVATGGGAGAMRGLGGGGAGGTVIVGLTGIPANTDIDLVVGGRGYGSDTPGSTGVPTNGGDTTVSIGGQQIMWAMGGVTDEGSTGGGPGGDPTFADSPYIIAYSGHAIAGGDGSGWNGSTGDPGSSYWGGGNFGSSGGADGAGGGSTVVSGFSGGSGCITITRVSN